MLIDTATDAWSLAEQSLAERQPTLIATIRNQREGLTAMMRDWTKDEIADQTAKAFGIELKTNVTKDALITVAVEAWIKTDAAWKELAALQVQARADELLREQLEDYETKAAALAAKLITAMNDAQWPSQVASELAYKTDAVMHAQALAQLARRIAKQVSEGKDIRVVALEIAQECMRLIMNFPGQIESGGTAGTYAAEHTTRVAAASEFIRMLGWTVMPEQVPAVWVTGY